MDSVSGNQPNVQPEEEIKSLKESEKEADRSSAPSNVLPAGDKRISKRRRKAQFVNGQRPRRRQAPSFFGPILVIALGVYFLLSNLNVISGELHWAALLSVWPLFLIFAGINIIVRQVPGFIGSFLSGLVGVSAAAVFAGVLLFAGQLPFIDDIAGSGSAEIKHASLDQPIRQPGTDEVVERAEIVIDMTQFPVSIDGQAPDGRLITGEIDYTGNFSSVYSVADGVGNFELRTTSQGWNFSSTSGNRWDLHLSDDIPLDLNLDLASGMSDNNLSTLQLTDLVIDAGSGSSVTRLPAGSYEVTADMGSGSSRFILPSEGQIEMIIDGGSGSVRLVLPSSMEARVIVDHGSGAFSPNGRFELVDGERFNDGVWQTEGYNPDDPNRIDIVLDIGSGSVTIGNE